MKVDTVADQDTLDRGQLMLQGGVNRLNRIFLGGKLEQVLGNLQQALWKDVG